MIIKLPTVTGNGKTLKNGIYSKASDAKDRARKLADRAKEQNKDVEIKCAYLKYDIVSINTGAVDGYYWSDRYSIDFVKGEYWVIRHDNCIMYSGINDPSFTKEKAETMFKKVLDEKVFNRDVKIYHMTLTDGVKIHCC